MTASEMREIPLNKLKPSPANVRRTVTDAGIEELAASIAAHGLLQMPVVQPERTGEGEETGCYLVTAGERRRKALLLLVTQKKLKKSAPITCLVRADGNAEELSLVENTVRLPMHPADQFEAFARLHSEQGLGHEEIAARFGVTPGVVRQRLKLAAVSPTLMARYREGELSLEQLMAFAVTDDHVLQEETLTQLAWNRSPETIRKALTSRHVSPRDRRAIFVGTEAYEAAGGAILRDLFAEDGGGWLTDSQLLDRLVREKLEAAAAAIRDGGWKWVEVHAEYPHALPFTRIRMQTVPLSGEDQARLDAITARYDELAAQHEGEDEVPEEVSAEIDAIDAEIAMLQQKQVAYLPEDIARAGVIVSLGQDGQLRIERGLVKPEDRIEAAPAERPAAVTGADDRGNSPEEPDGLRPLPDTLLADLTAHRTAALQECLAARPDVALTALTHALALQTFGGGGYDPPNCLGIKLETASLEGSSPGIGGSRAGEAMVRRHEAWARRLPASGELWTWIDTQDASTRLDLLAYCVARTIDAMRYPNGRRRALAHADQLAMAVSLDMTAWWEATGERYLARVPKARILEAVREGASEREAESLAGLKKDAMTLHAERLLAGKGWLPEVLRAPALPASVEADKDEPAMAAE
ncbi:MAG: ParB N-terminal domain-containing protein [Rhodocyclaceae bacterium]|nr:ParB N-terminal domain-containing protein [Rhodocyclaceae bacterium]